MSQTKFRSSALILGLCAFIAMFEGFDLQAAGVAAPRLAPALGLAPLALGWFFSASTFGMFAGAIAGGLLSDHVGRRAVLLASIALFGLFSIATAFATDLQGLVAARFVTGVGLGGALPNLVALVAEAILPARRNVAIGLLYGGMPFGGAMASLLSLLGGAQGSWQTLFYIGGILPLVTIPLLGRFLPVGRRAARAPAFRPGMAAAVLGENRALQTLLLWLGFYLALVILYLLMNWLPTLLIGRGLTRPDAAWVQVTFNLCGAGGAVVMGWCMDRPRLRTVALGGIFAGGAVMLLVVAEAPVTFILSLAIGAALGATVMGSQSALYSLAPGLYPMQVRGTGVGMGVAFGRLGSATGPLLAGQLLALGWSASAVLLALVPMILLCGVATTQLSRAPVIGD